MSSPSTSRVGSAAESIDSASPVSQAGEPWLPEPGELPTTPWYEEKTSTLRLSDIPIIKDKGGMMGKFEVVIPHPDERAHRPPPGFFYAKCDLMRDPWKCEMHWRDSAVTIVPRTPDRAPSLTPFLEAMHDKSYSAPELIREDLLCFYKFSMKGVELVGDLDERMGKAELLRAMQEAAAAPPKKSTKSKAPSMGEKEARGEKRKKAGASTSGARTEEAPQPKQAPPPPTPSSEEALDVPPVTAAKSYASLPVRNWAYVPSWSGLFICVEELREFASAELGLCAELVGLIRSARVITRGAR
ncbi:hypothetical protein F511_10071 [Dorcoceras hygrometricum]|uniref:Uncharacterized protein n=1 Tax=Dorcoceras hygrometricum TaxID=472368 RepID=A0A2Z7A4T4_9LAMI|nr:hypothetical protein F511_10071 [Dorcoceras hygrometricum]